MTIFTSDHGESLGENNCFCDHGNLADIANIRIPLLIDHPNVKSPLKINSLLENIDLAPSILSELGLTFSSEVDGIDFSYLYHDRMPDAELREFFHSSTPQIYSGHYKTVGTSTRKLVVRDSRVLLDNPKDKREFALIESLRHSYDLPEAYRFYDISGGKLDVEENRINPAEEERERFSEEARKIGTFWGSAKGVEPEISEEEKERLKGLGYLR